MRKFLLTLVLACASTWSHADTCDTVIVVTGGSGGFIAGGLSGGTFGVWAASGIGTAVSVGIGMLGSKICEDDTQDAIEKDREDYHDRAKLQCLLYPNTPWCIEFKCVLDPDECEDPDPNDPDEMLLYSHYYGMGMDMQLIVKKDRWMRSLLTDLHLCGGACTGAEIIGAYNMPDQARWAYFTSLRAARGYVFTRRQPGQSAKTPEHLRLRKRPDGRIQSSSRC